jgi:hypothetical protein
VNCDASGHGTTAVGILTHLALGTGTVWGTTVRRAIEMVQQDGGPSLSVRNG